MVVGALRSEVSYEGLITMAAVNVDVWSFSFTKEFSRRLAERLPKDETNRSRAVEDYLRPAVGMNPRPTLLNCDGNGDKQKGAT